MTSAPLTPAYDRLAKTFTRLHHLEHLQSIAYWDQAAMMPGGGAEARAAALAEVATLMHQLRTDPALGPALARATDEPLSEHQRANLREIGREWRAANALPETLVQRSQLATSRCGQAWRAQRTAACCIAPSVFITSQAAPSRVYAAGRQSAIAAANSV